MKLSSAYLGHHGLVAGLYDELGIGEIIDKTLPKQGQHKLPHSVIVKAMLINALGFNERRLYMFPGFSRILIPSYCWEPALFLKISTMTY